MRLIEVTGLKETHFSNPFSICCLHNRSQQHLGQVTGAGMGEGRVSLRQEHFLLLLLYYLLHAHLFFRFGWNKEPSHQAAPILAPALWPRWRKNLQLFSETLRTVWYSPRTKWKHCISWDGRRWKTLHLVHLLAHSPSSFSLSISLNITLQNHSVSFFLPSHYKHTFFSIHNKQSHTHKRNDN